MIPLEETILKVVRSRQRDVAVGVIPKAVQAHLPVSIAEQTCRRYMARMWKAGRLYRFGGTGARRGYRALKVDEVRLEREVVALLDRNPWGLVAELVAELLDVRLDVVRDYLPQLEYRGEILFHRGAWRLPSPMQRVAFRTAGHFGYRAA